MNTGSQISRIILKIFFISSSYLLNISSSFHHCLITLIAFAEQGKFDVSIHAVFFPRSFWRICLILLDYIYDISSKATNWKHPIALRCPSDWHFSFFLSLFEFLQGIRRFDKLLLTVPTGVQTIYTLIVNETPRHFNFFSFCSLNNLKPSGFFTYQQV